jgi:hypothetical protein
LINPDDYISLPDIATTTGVTYATALSWGKHHHYYKIRSILGRNLVLKTEFEKFKAAHPELIKKQPVTAGE